MRSALFSLLLLTLITTSAPTHAAKQQSWSLVQTTPRAPNHFTQGLVYANQQLFESTGRYGQSAVITYDATTLTQQKKHALPADIFGEGLTFLHGKLYQASWKAQKIFIYDTELQQLQTLPIQGEGWGLTTDGTSLILSNGSNTLQFLDPKTGKVQRILRIKDPEKIWTQINELEWINGYIFANIWFSNTVLVIDGTTGDVAGYYDFSTLSAAVSNKQTDDVLNGLAWNPVTQTLLVTGKNWPQWFAVKIQFPKNL
ncbi:MAG: glutaminyl-peptide cyclotransferase [Cellvibrionales bacterium]|jgi:glutamine cyclotransferase|nr:glutaminyl-peptide cyclotransferase [Cellvibrionales bacterium]MBK8676791.1 glutaminyl-peptide cyclotransferase [Cellvibrionales bacterium]HRF87814.1 glutaminyl-peptide cyclotransferase [Pseudomonadales bacterium]HRG50548.1 glutaminyl-peptide cyclotransferase [Pseudomonadales bacterium]